MLAFKTNSYENGIFVLLLAFSLQYFLIIAISIY